MSDKIEERVRALIVNHLGVDENRIVNDDRLEEELGADSLDAVELLMAAEEEFGIDIPDDAAEKIKTVGEAVAYIKGAVA